MKAIKYVLISLLFVGFTQIAYGQEDKAKEASEQPKTKIEQFLVKGGAVIIKSYKEIGTVSGDYRGTTSVDVIELTNSATGRKEYGVRVDVKEMSRIERTHASYIDGDEIDSLIKGIEYILTIDQNKTRYPMFEATYMTRGDLKITVFNNKNGALSLSISSGYVYKTQMFGNLKHLDMIKNYLIEAKKEIPAISKSESTPKRKR